MASGEVFTFGPFTLDTQRKQLTRDGASVSITSRQFDLLQYLVTHAGQVLSKDALIEAVWPDVAATDNSLEQAISNLRRTLSSSCIETQARRGYRFIAEVTRLDRRESDEGIDALMAPHRAWLEGRAALETLERDQIVHARRVFETVLAQVPGQASAHVGLANACAMQFDMTRSEATPDVAALALALEHAREACRLDAQYGEAWAMLGFVLERTGRHDDALAASRRAVALEPDNWRHHLRLGYTSWGEERLREARRTLSLLPGFPMAHWLAATVHVARQAFGDARRELESGIAAQEATPSPRFSGVALHWLRGLVALSQEEPDTARGHFERELSQETSGHLYARECCANTWYALGALAWRQGDHEAAGRAFGESLARMPGHLCARVAQAVTVGRQAAVPEPGASVSSSSFERALATAVLVAMTNGTDGAARAAAILERTLSDMPSGSAGWLIPVEPMLHVETHPVEWATVLARLRNRAA